MGLIWSDSSFLWLRPGSGGAHFGWITRWEFLPPFFDLQGDARCQEYCDLRGVPGLVDSFARFALQG